MNKDTSKTDESVDGSQQKLGWMESHIAAAKKNGPSLSANQSTSISAMIAYISRKSGQSEFNLERRLSDRFNIPNPKCLSATDFDKAIQYLADIVSE